MRALPFILLFGLFCQTGVAQVSIGHRAGVSLSNWVVSGGSDYIAEGWNEDQRLNPGLSVEVPVQIPVYRKAMLNTGLAFIQQGYSQSNPYWSNYLQIPLTAGWRFDVHRFSFTPSIGGAYGLNVRGKGTSLDNHSFPIGRIEDKGYGYRLPDQQWSILARSGLAYAWGNSAITLDLSYQHGLSNAMFDFVFTDINGNPITPPWEFPTASQRSYVIQLGYQLTLGSGHRSPKLEAMPTDTIGASATKQAGGSKVMVGTRFGVTSSTMSFSASLPEEQTRVVDGAEPLIGVTAAIMLKLQLNEHWSLRPELAYMQKGWRAQWFPRPTMDNDLLRMTYLELPVLLSYEVIGHKLRPYVLGGPVIGHGLGGVQVYHAVGGTLYGDFYSARSVTFGEQPTFGDYNPWDLSLQGGVGLSMSVGLSELNLDVRYQHGLSDTVQDGTPNLYSEVVEASHRNWILNIGYLVPWRK